MTLQEEAFNAWGESVGSFGFDYLEVWNAACKWQRDNIKNNLYYCGEEYCMTFEDYRGLFNEYD